MPVLLAFLFDISCLTNFDLEASYKEACRAEPPRAVYPAAGLILTSSLTCGPVPAMQMARAPYQASFKEAMPLFLSLSRDVGPGSVSPCRAASDSFLSFRSAPVDSPPLHAVAVAEVASLAAVVSWRPR